MGFSWKEQSENAIKIKQERAIIQAKGNINKDFDIQHPDWVREGSKENPNNTAMLKTIKDNTIKHQQQAIKRRLKRIGK